MADQRVDVGDDFAQEEFERVRQESLRAFEVTLTDGKVISLFAHFHDAGATAAGHLSFIVIDPNGRQIVDRVFSVHVWQELKEVSADPQKMAQAKERLSVILAEGSVEVAAVNTNRRRKRSIAKMVRKDVH